jgi:xanthine/CO dehydrogenase XdhC/CoxF family maturation factor
LFIQGDQWSSRRPQVAGSAHRLERKVTNKEPLLLLDIRDRAPFTIKHRDGARNIPLDELPVRAENELSTDQTIIIYGDDDPEKTDLAYSILDTQGFSYVFVIVPNAIPIP